MLHRHDISDKIWAKILKSVMDAPDLSCTIIDEPYVKCHIHASGARGRTQGMAVAKGG